MKSDEWFSKPLTILFLFLFFAFLSSMHAQEELPKIVKRIMPSTVVIMTYDEEEKNIAQGSGFFINQKGDILTNWHVLQKANSAKVKTAEGKVYPITKIIAEDREGDIIQVSVDIPLEDIYPLKVSNSIPEVGEKVIVVGNPLGFEQTVTDGIISAVREIPVFGKIIQISAPVSPGSSGSPVVNAKGEVIGIASFQIAEGQNLNFAVPGERILKLVPGKGKTFSEWRAGESKQWLISPEGLYYWKFRNYSDSDFGN